MKKACHNLLLLDFIQTICQPLFIGIICLLLLSACAESRRYDDYAVYTTNKPHDKHNYGVGRFKSSYLAQQIDDHYRGINPGPIGVATFVDIDDLYKTSTFGRVYAEQVMSELSMRGFDVIELRHADALQFLTNDGEFALSRDVSVLKRGRNLGGIVVGTYAVSDDRVYVNARLIDPKSSLIHAAASVEMPKTREIKKMLRGGNTKQVLERIPIQQLNKQGLVPTIFDSNPLAMKTQRWENEELSMDSTILPPQPALSGIKNPKIIRK